MRRLRTSTALALLVALFVCAQPGLVRAKPFGDASLQCVPYARQLSGIQLSGDAWTWWRSAAVGYRRSQQPNPMSVLVLRRTGQLPRGHVAVVRSVVSEREMRVDHANWDDHWTRGRIYKNMTVIDVSPRNDWTVLQFWNGAGYGKSYAAYGFIDNHSFATDATVHAAR